MKRGFSLVELLIVLIIIGIGIAMFYSTLYVNWTSFEKQVSSIDLQMEADKISEVISDDGRYAKTFSVLSGGKQAHFEFPDSTTVDYFLTPQGQIQRSLNGAAAYNVSEFVDYNNSLFKMSNSCLVGDIALSDIVFGQKTQLSFSVQVFPRNQT